MYTIPPRKFIAFVFCLIAITTSVTATPISEGVTVKAHSINIPVIKGISLNPILQVIVAIPANAPEQTITELIATLHPDAINDIQQIDLYLTGAGPFSANQLLTSMQPLRLLFYSIVEGR